MSNQGIPSGRGRLPVQQRDRRPALAALALLLVVAGALGSALIAYRSGNRIDVLTVSTDVAPGHKMTSSDFGVTRIAGDSAGMVKAEFKDRFVGSYATTRIPSRTLINARMFTAEQVLPSDGQVVGIQLAPEQRPTLPLAPGDVVQLYLAPTGTGGGASAPSAGAGPGAGAVLVAAARVRDVDQSTGTSSGSSSDLGVSVLLSSADAAVVLPLAAQHQVGVALLPPGTKPAIDFVDS